MPLLTFQETAKALGIPAGTLRDCIARGLEPTVAGARGRGKKALFDLDAVRAWRASQGDPLRRVRERAARIPDIVVAETLAMHARAGHDRELVAKYLGALAMAVILAIEDELRDAIPGLPLIDAVPDKIAGLRR